MTNRRNPHRPLTVSLSVIVWLVVSVFSCASFAGVGAPEPTQPHGSYEAMAAHAGHDMGSMGEVPSSSGADMPCCEQAQADCCPTLASVAKPYHQFQVDKILPVSLALQLTPRPVHTGLVGGKSCSRQLRHGYPRLHLVHCTLLD